ncbi:MAG: threonine dehydratase [Candidatus Hydrogenedentales bacterium]
MATAASKWDQWREYLSLDGVRVAAQVVRKHLRPTPLLRHPLLAEAAGVDLYLKHENHLPTGAFKVRGGLNYMANEADRVREHGVVTATRGNHGQSIAMAAQQYDVPCTIVVPHGNNPDKNAAIRAYGSALVETGRDFDEAREHVEQLVRERGMTYVHSANEPHLIHGVGTYWLEVLEDVPDVDTVYVPLGGGSAVCGAVVVLRALKPDTRIVGVQAANAPSLYESWKAGRKIETETADTIADGLATRVPFDLPFAVLRDEVDDIVLVTEEEIRAAILLLLQTTHNLAEGAGAAATAAVIKDRNGLQGQKVVAVLSGGNIDLDTLHGVMHPKKKH